MPEPGAGVSSATEDVLDPELPILDPHHHLWEHPTNRYMTEELRADTHSGHNVVRTVFVECGSSYRAEGPEVFRPVGETDFVVAADPDGFIAGIVGFADLTAPDVADVLAAHVEAGAGRFRGIRHVNAFDPSPDIRRSHTNPPGSRRSGVPGSASTHGSTTHSCQSSSTWPAPTRTCRSSSTTWVVRSASARTPAAATTCWPTGERRWQRWRRATTSC
jgi:hypothetical protein